MRVLALALVARDVDALAHGRDGDFLGVGIDGECLVNLIFDFRRFRYDEEGGRGRRERKLLPEHDGRALAVGSWYGRFERFVDKRKRKYEKESR